MALQSFYNNFGIVYHSVLDRGTTSTQGTMDAAGESNFSIGYCVLEGGSGSKTISSAGGKIHWAAGGITFANGSTILRVGIQDVATSGLEDGTFDVYGDYTSAAAPTASSFNTKAMSSGTKTISHGDLIAVGLEMTARGGTDSVMVTCYTTIIDSGVGGNNIFPYRSTDTGSGPTRIATGAIIATIEFDDGTLGWIMGGYVFRNINSITATGGYNSGSATDEYASVFKIPFKCSISGCYVCVGDIASTDAFEVVLYSDAQGTPVAEVTTTIDPDYVGSTTTTSQVFVRFASPFTLSPGVWYAISVRPTTANSITYGLLSLGSGYEHFKSMFPFGDNCKVSSRTNQTGAFTEVLSYYVPRFGLIIDKLDDGVGGGVTSYAYLS